MENQRDLLIECYTEVKETELRLADYIKKLEAMVISLKGDHLVLHDLRAKLDESIETEIEAEISA